MKLKHKILNKYTILSLSIIITLLTLFITSIRLVNVKMSNGKENIKTIIPLIEHSNLAKQKSKEYYITGSVYSSLFSQHVVNITPDDCITYLKINKVNVDLTKLVKGNTCDFAKGFDIDLKKYLKNGTNTLEIGLVDYGGWFGLSVKNSYYDMTYLSFLGVLTIESIAILYLILRNYLHLPRTVTIAIILGILLRFFYLSYTTSGEKTYDVFEYGGHLDYIKFVANNLQLPMPKLENSWEYEQAPLYYITGSVIYKLFNNLSLDYRVALQVLSLVYSSIFLIFGVLILQIVCKKKIAFFTSTALLAFWPSEIIHSIRIGNDQMYYMVSATSMYFLLKWLLEKQNKYLYLASVFIALTISTKLNGLILIGIFGISVLYGYFKQKKKRKTYLKITFLSTCIILLGLFFSLFRNVKAAIVDHQVNVVFGIAYKTLDPSLSVENNLHNFLAFDTKTFITKPFTDSRNNLLGRQYFWNYLLKTMLFGEFNFQPYNQQILAISISTVLSIMIVFFFIGLIRKITSPHIIMLLWLTLSLVSLIYFRHTYPDASNEDFRYILPTIIPIIYFYVSGVNVFLEKKLKMIGCFGYFLAFLFIAGSFIFFLIP